MNEHIEKAKEILSPESYPCSSNSYCLCLHCEKWRYIVITALAELEAAESKPEPTELLSDVRLIIETAIQEGRETGYSPTAEEWNNISKLCDHIDSLQEQLAAKDKDYETLQRMYDGVRKELADLKGE